MRTKFATRPLLLSALSLLAFAHIYDLRKEALLPCASLAVTNDFRGLPRS